MGEIRIKSGNLYPIAIGEDTWNNLNDATHNNNNGELVVSMMDTDNNSGVYSHSDSAIRTVHKDLSTYSWSVEIKADSPGKILLGFQSDGVKIRNITNEYQKFTFDNQSFTSDSAFVVYNRTGVANTVYLRNFMLNEGSTNLPFQPYFLNKPAHQFTNGQWVDIPTHHFINNRWQGELTSQSPLKFRADGEMLDWRIEGKTSGNLVESFRTSVNTEQYKICLLGKLDIKPSTSYTISFIMEEGAKAYFSEYIFEFKNFIGTGQRQVLNIITKDNINKNASTWTDEYGWILCKNMINNENPCNFREVMILEGSYTSDTFPPYEPYGGVGDWDETEQKYKIPVRVEGENLYTIPIGEDSWGNNVNATHRNNNGELIVEMGTGNDSGVYSRAGSTIGAVHSALSNGSWSVEIKADSPMNLRLGFVAEGAKFIDITTEYQKFTFSNQNFTSGSSFIIYNRTGVAHTVYLKNFEIYFDNETNLYTDHQLMDGDSIDYATTQTAIPIATGNNTLTVDTAVQPSKVSVKFEG